QSAQWDDLRVRAMSGLAMATIGIAGMIAGGVWFQMLSVFVTAVMVWELWMMVAPQRPTVGMLLAAGCAALVSGKLTAPGLGLAILMLVPPTIGILLLKEYRKTFFGFAFAILLAGWGLVTFREDFGIIWMLWLVLVVVVTDVAGYFVGRTVGGPKFWPKLSPKKTWSGVLGGWGAAALVGAVFGGVSGGAGALAVISILLSFASQIGDLMESWLKRKVGVKDSSALIPGHGGLFDRFDGLLGAALAMLAVAALFDVPEVAW
ncbi:MAG: phosphatidate cytidylyltransferase, partial [Shimia sp.]